MKYILSEQIALRSWRLVPRAYYIMRRRSAKGLKPDEYELLTRCDGTHEIEPSPLLTSLLERNLCRAAREGETLSPWQRERFCDNRYFPAMNWMITGKCNYNCRHCFNAADNNRLQSEFTLEEAEKLIGEAEKCGINAFTITGGEPMMHPHFMDIIRGIHAHGMYVEELNTNGFFLTQEILDEMKTIGCYPLIKISFDGIGHHDWLRNRDGAEEDALRAIRLCTANGFRVMVQTNVHRLNLHTMLPTAKLMNELGVEVMRIIRTSESPRWIQNAGDVCLTLEEYFDGMVELFREYAQTDCKMELDVWVFAHLSTRDKTFIAGAVEHAPGEYRDTLPVCALNRSIVAVGANGNLYPCHQQSGHYERLGWFLGNVKTDSLQKLLQDGNYIKNVCMTVKELKEHNEKCASCRWFKLCGGGCRAFGLALTGDLFGCDPTKCLFFEENYLQKLMDALPGYKCLNPYFSTPNAQG